MPFGDFYLLVKATEIMSVTHTVNDMAATTIEDLATALEGLEQQFRSNHLKCPAEESLLISGPLLKKPRMDRASFQGCPKIGKENLSPPNGVSSTVTNSHRVSFVDSNLSLYLKEAVTNINTDITTTKTHQSSPLKDVQNCSKPRHVSNETLVPHRLNGAREKTQLQVSLAVDDGKQLTQEQMTWPGLSSSVPHFQDSFLLPID
jgi:hypothetical protein